MFSRKGSTTIFQVYDDALCVEPLPPLNKVFSIITPQERQLQIRIFHEPTTLALPQSTITPYFTINKRINFNVMRHI